MDARNASPWTVAGDRPVAPRLPGDLSAEICVIGAGITGMTTAYLLAGEGRDVVVLDGGPIGGGETERTTAHLSTALDDRYSLIEQLYGEHGARIAASSHAAAIDKIERIVATERIICDFERVDGYLFVPPGEPDHVLDSEIAAAHRAGLTDVERLTRAPLPSFDTGPCLRFPRQGQFHPIRYLGGLARALARDGGRVFTDALVTEIGTQAPIQVRTRYGARVTARNVVIATNVPINDVPLLHAKQAPYMTYVLGLAIPRGSVPRSLYWDTGSLRDAHPRSYHYVRVYGPRSAKSGNGDWELLLVGGEDRRTGDNSDGEGAYSRLEQWTRDRFPMAREVVYQWSGEIMESVDGLAFIGRYPSHQPHVFVATGDSGMGMTHGTIAGMLLTDLIVGRQSPWASIYEPSRKPVRAAPEWLRNNLRAGAHIAKGLVKGGPRSAGGIQNGQGAVIVKGKDKIAAYRDEDSKVHERSAVCPHMGCLVAWNAAERTWDCPCHGSRFDAYGHVIHGPATSDLAQPDHVEPEGKGSRR
jgi:glycine/D-amino acid oxidase-like deaminating enzyme/nitrite reductase/ring-hydroxylating ferredoxin subunit